MSLRRLPLQVLFNPVGRRLLSSKILSSTSSLLNTPDLFANGKLNEGDSEIKQTQSRCFHTGSTRKGKILIGIKHGHQDDPELWPMDRDIKGYEKVTGWYYRTGRKYPDDYPLHERAVTHFLSAFFWFWLFYHFYWDSGYVFGEWYIPDTYEFTDEELGIPPDDAPDPEYWGYQQEHYTPPKE